MTSGIYKRTEYHKNKIKEGITPEVKLKMSQSLKIKGIIPPSRKGTKSSEKTIRKLREIHKGEKSHLWKGGNSRGYKTGYYSSQYKQWRRDVFIRDEFTCHECGKKHIYITAHHIKSFTHFPELRFDTNNGITLCEECHSKTDNYKGHNKRKAGVD